MRQGQVCQGSNFSKATLPLNPVMLGTVSQHSLGEHKPYANPGPSLLCVTPRGKLGKTAISPGPAPAGAEAT